MTLQQVLDDADKMGYSPDICSYARINIACVEMETDEIPGLPKPNFVVCTNNICNVLVKWYESLSRQFDVPFFLIDVPFNKEETAQLYDLIAEEMEQSIKDGKSQFPMMQPEMRRQIVEDTAIPFVSFDGDQSDPKNFSEAQFETRIQVLVENIDARREEADRTTLSPPEEWSR
jgi:benzoyl-CoA reductase/2-hydroxyglutaryl-CoA dehydratase subunit BcrC/BadD/HgdB